MPKSIAKYKFTGCETSAVMELIYCTHYRFSDFVTCVTYIAPSASNASLSPKIEIIPTTATIVSIRDQVRIVSFILRLKYSLNSQNPVSFT